MHGSHKLWITIAVFLVVIGLLLGMYFTATPDKVGSVMKNKQSGKLKAAAEKKYAAKDLNGNVAGQATTQAEDNKLPDELQSLDLESIKAEHGAGTAEPETEK